MGNDNDWVSYDYMQVGEDKGLIHGRATEVNRLYLNIVRMIAELLLVLIESGRTFHSFWGVIYKSHLQD